MKTLVLILVVASFGILGLGKLFTIGVEGELASSVKTPSGNNQRWKQESKTVSENEKSPQQIRDEEFIRTTGERNFDELVESLDHGDGDNFAIADATSLTAGLDPSVNLRAILADRRVAKLYEMLSQMTAEEASEKLQDVFENKLKKFMEDWERASKSENGTLLGSNRHGLSAILFLVCEFCPESQFVGYCRSWFEWYEELGGVSRYKKRAGPQPLLVINLYALALIRRGESIQQVNARVATLCEEIDCGPLPELQLLPFYKWDDTANNKSNAIKMVPGFRNWGRARKIWGTGYNSEPYRTKAVSTALRWLEPRGRMQSWIIDTTESTVEWFKNNFGREK